MLQRFLRYIRAVPGKKHYLEFVTATLSIPVLITVIMINLGNLNGEEKTKGSNEPEKIIVSYAPQAAVSASANDPKDAVAGESDICSKEIGPVNISYPEEGDIITDNPLEVIIDKDESGEYCAIVWSYRINNGRWSEYDDKSLALYNLPTGPKTLEVRVKSVTGGEAEILKRTFDYQGEQVDIVPTEGQEITVTPGGQ